MTTALLEAGVGLRDVWETVAGLYERVSPIVLLQMLPFKSQGLTIQGEEDREFLEEEAGVVFTHWLKEKESIPAAEVSCLLRSVHKHTS